MKSTEPTDKTFSIKFNTCKQDRWQAPTFKHMVNSFWLMLLSGYKIRITKLNCDDELIKVDLSRQAETAQRFKTLYAIHLIITKSTWTHEDAADNQSWADSNQRHCRWKPRVLSNHKATGSGPISAISSLEFTSIAPSDRNFLIEASRETFDKQRTVFSVKSKGSGDAFLLEEMAFKWLIHHPTSCIVIGADKAKDFEGESK